MAQPDTTSEQRTGKPRRSFSKPFNPIGAVIEYLHIVATIMLICVLISVPYVYLKKKPKFSAEGLLNINPYMPKILYRVEDTNYIHSFEDWMRTQVKVVTSYPVLEWAIKDYEAQGFTWCLPNETMQSAVSRLVTRLKVIQIRDTQLISLTMESPSNNGLAEILNSVIKGYINSIDNNTHSQDSYKLEVLKKEFKKVQQELDEGYRNLEEISIKYGTAITEEKNLYIYFESLSDLKKTYNKLVADRILAESRMKALAAKSLSLKDLPLSGLVADWIDSGQGLSALIIQISSRVQEVKEQLVGLAPDNPQHILLKRRKSEMEAQVERLRQWLSKNQGQTIRGKLNDENSLAIENARTDFKTAQGAERMLLKEMERAQKELLEYNSAVLHAQTKRQEIQRLMETLTRINERIDQIQMEFASPGRITVTAWALKPETPNVDPRKKLVPVCFILSLLVGVGVALAREISDNRIKRPADVDKMLGFPLTGFLLRADEEQISSEDLYTLHLRHRRSFMAQQLFEIIVKIDRERLGHGSKVYAFTGLGDGCGVTMLAMNLLAMSSVPKERRLYIDLNTRNPAGSREPLKSDLMTDDGSNLPQGFLDGSDERFPFVFYPCPADQQERLVNSREDLQALLKEMRQSFDMIVLDLPPLLLSADTQAVVSLADVTVLVALARHSLWGQLMRSVSMLDNLNIKVISVILNRVGFVRGGYLRKNLQAYYTLGREKKRQLLGTLDMKVFLKPYFATGRAMMQRLFNKD
jgi:capsular polysaccharide biosynthesis protein/cellulose biosynthesis protein BcsQ